jgi:hypothetical protein
MSTRWLPGILLFALGFGSAVLVRLPEADAADAAAEEGVVEGNLKFIDGADFRLVYPPGGKTDYLIVVSRKSGTVKDSPPRISYHTGAAAFAKKDLQNVTVYHVKPLVIWTSGAETSGVEKAGAEKASARRVGVFRCGSGPFLCPLPPIPPPIGSSYSYAFLKSGAVRSGQSQ